MHFAASKFKTLHSWAVHQLVQELETNDLEYYFNIIIIIIIIISYFAKLHTKCMIMRMQERDCRKETYRTSGRTSKFIFVWL